MLSEKKAVNFLKPWWDVAFQGTLIALMALAFLMLLLTAGFGQDHKSNQDSLGSSRHVEKASRHKKNGQIDLIVRSRFTTDDASYNLTKSSSVQMDLINGSVADYRGNGDKSNRVKRSIPDHNLTLPSIHSNNAKNEGSRIKESNDESRDNFNAIYNLVILGITYLLELGFNRIFYSDHLMLSLVHLISTLSDVREFQKTNHGLIFANTLHHAHNRSFLWTIFWLKNFIRLVLVIIALSLTAHFHLNGDISSTHPDGFYHTKFSIAVLMIMLNIGILGLSLYSLCWPWIVATSPWGLLMQKYTLILNKIDVARGRCVPGPSSAASLPPKFMLPSSPIHMLSKAKSSVERVVDALNPYTASPNIRLILDMVAYKSGLGVALRNLAFLEIDVHNNWRPFRPHLSFLLDPNGESSLEVSWRDPLAILYLIPVPSELQLHYGIEIEFALSNELLERVVEIVGYQESRYFRKIWHYQHRQGSVASDMEGSTLTLNPENEEQGRKDSVITNEPFIYREVFSNIQPPPGNGNVKVSVWTIIDGQLIAKSTVTTINEAEPSKQATDENNYSPNSSILSRPITQQVTPPAPPKPPRQVGKDDFSFAALQETNPVIEEDEEGIKVLAKQISVQIEEQKRRRQRKKLFESKSLTNLKQEIRRSMKRRHRFSGDPSQDHRLRKSRSVGEAAQGQEPCLPLKSHQDFRPLQQTTSATKGAKIRCDSESGISNEAFEADEEMELSHEQII